MYARAAKARPKSWTAIQDDYLRALEALDDNLVAGSADMGDLQNGKGDFFNDLLALILEGCAGVGLYSRQLVPGFIFPTHNLDITFPSTRVAKFLAEAKAVGTPKTKLNPKQRNPLGRGGSADVRKRVAELAPAATRAATTSRSTSSIADRECPANRNRAAVGSVSWP